MPRLRSLELMSAVIPRHKIGSRVGRIRSLSANMVSVSGLSDVASVGHRVVFEALGVQGEDRVVAGTIRARGDEATSGKGLCGIQGRHGRAERISVDRAHGPKAPTSERRETRA